MSLVDLVAALMFVGVVAYAIFGGADFGAGVWDLTAGGDHGGGHLRSLIDRSIGPVWEANHVWLIYILVFLWSAFPRAFGALMETLFVPWLLLAVGIVLRGGAFAFRKFSTTMSEARLHGVVFALSSLLTPLVLGMIAGAVASGRVPLDGSGGRFTSWTGPTSIVGGLLAVLTCTFLAGTFLAADAERSGEHQLAERIGHGTLRWGLATGVVALSGAFAIRSDAKTLADGLLGRGLPFIALSAIAGSATLVMLASRRWNPARMTAILAVASIVVGWAVAQYPDLLVDHATLESAAGARPTLIGLVIVFAVAGVTAVPALVWLYVLVNRESWARAEH